MDVREVAWSPAVGSRLPSHTYSPSASQLSPRPSTALSFGLDPIYGHLVEERLQVLVAEAAVAPQPEPVAAVGAHLGRSDGHQDAQRLAQPVAELLHVFPARGAAHAALAVHVPRAAVADQTKVCAVRAYRSMRSFMSRPDSQGISEAQHPGPSAGVWMMVRAVTRCMVVMMPPS